jgi:hypothetical protein
MDEGRTKPLPELPPEPPRRERKLDPDLTALIDARVEGALQSLCAHCHSSRKQSIERRGYDTAVGIDGWPIDPRHPCYGGSQ